MTKPTNHREHAIKTLIDRFHYPRCGPGMMWERVADEVCRGAADLHLQADIGRISVLGEGVASITYRNGAGSQTIEGSHFISSMPVRELVEKLDPQPPAEILAAARSLKYWDFITVALVVNQAELFPDNWIYVHDPGVRVGRIQNFKNWSPAMVPDPDRTGIGLEYFCFEGDDLWEMADADLVDLGTTEVEKLGLIPQDSVVDGRVLRMPKAYPVYDDHHQAALNTIRRHLDGIENLQLVGRNGMHKYNNQDHSMFTAMLAVENLLGVEFDLWSVNTDDHYHEEIAQTDGKARDSLAKLNDSQPYVPVTVSQSGA